MKTQFDSYSVTLAKRHHLFSSGNVIYAIIFSVKVNDTQLEALAESADLEVETEGAAYFPRFHRPYLPSPRTCHELSWGVPESRLRDR